MVRLGAVRCALLSQLSTLVAPPSSTFARIPSRDSAPSRAWRLDSSRPTRLRSLSRDGTAAASGTLLLFCTQNCNPEVLHVGTETSTGFFPPFTCIFTGFWKAAQARAVCLSCRPASTHSVRLEFRLSPLRVRQFPASCGWAALSRARASAANLKLDWRGNNRPL